MTVIVAPHPPIIVPGIGGGKESESQATINGMKKLADDIAKLKPKTIAVVSPHGNVFSDALCVNLAESLNGDFGDFGYRNLRYSFVASKKADDLVTAFKDAKLPCVALDKKTARQYNASQKLDHGALVPLHYIKQAYNSFALLHINIGFLPKLQMAEAGKVLRQIVGDESVIVISGDLSHRLSQDAPAGYDAKGQVYDKAIAAAVADGDWLKLLTLDEALVDGAGQCAQKPLEMLAGVVDGEQTKSCVYSYEGPFGVGYLTAKITLTGKPAASVLQAYVAHRKAQSDNNAALDPYVALATQTIESYIKTGKKAAVPKGLPAEFYNTQKGVFVSIKKGGDLRGCIGTISGVQSNMAEEVIENAISAATRDPRFSAVRADELNSLKISVDVLGEAEPIDSMDALDVKKYGVIVSKGFRRGLLLPNLQGVNTVSHQVEIARQKAGIGPNEQVCLERFEVVRHE